jgi:hypothetical protein
MDRHPWHGLSPLGWLIGLAVALVLTAAPAGQARGDDVGPEGEWVNTGPPAKPQQGNTLGTLVTLPDGTALLVGPQVQRYHPDTGAWTPAGSLLGSGGLPTVLADGKVLVTGSSAEVYDPATQTSTLTGAMIIPRTNHQATVLPSGDVLVSGGADANQQLVGPAEIYHSASGTWSLTGTMNDPRRGHTAILLPTGKVLAAGGSGPQSNLTSAELYDPTTGLWTFTSPNSVGGAAGTLLADGKALVVGSESLNLASQLFDSLILHLKRGRPASSFRCLLVSLKSQHWPH